MSFIRCVAAMFGLATGTVTYRISHGWRANDFLISLFSLWDTKFVIAQSGDCKQAMSQTLTSPN
jgi:hypothetical protein